MENLNLLNDFFGYIPNFHDSEITEVNLNRTGPNINMAIHIFEITPRITVGKSCLVYIIFEGVVEMELRDFNIQNVIFEIDFLKMDGVIKTTIDSSYGLNGYIVASKVYINELKELS